MENKNNKRSVSINHVTVKCKREDPAPSFPQQKRHERRETHGKKDTHTAQASEEPSHPIAM